jgi:CubicO group peptidase (beta-lactamase class C family)
MRIRPLPAVLLTLVLTGAPACRGGGDLDYWPTQGWRSGTPEAQGMDSAPLAALDEEFAKGKHGYVDGILVIRRGYVVWEKSYRHDYDRLFVGKDTSRGPYNYYDPDWHPHYQRGELHTLQSVTKSVTSALIGIAIRRGEIPGVEVKALPYFEGYEMANPDPRKAEITLRHLLTMTAGFLWDESTIAYTDPRNSCALMEASEDWVQFVLDQPMAQDPGQGFVYNSGVSQLLSFILKRATGKEADDYAAEQLFQPLGIESYYWKRTPKGLADTEGGLYLTARDLAKIGYLYLKDGVWEGRRLLAEGWVAASTAPSVEAAPSGSGRRYGYQWWLLPWGGKPAYAYAALGYGGQRLLVVPEHDLIAVFTGWNIYDLPALDPRLALDSILRSIEPSGSQ